ncbi:MAG TPA: MerR family transcriptional regulator [Burkholderiales bacterium]|nr:MerR family transcriptional regulator [Burkholderiales bacterium]
MDEDGLTIARFADAAGVGVETVRYYQRRGLLPVPQARHASYRRYDQSLVQRLRFIKNAQAAGFTLAEIRELMRLDRTGDRLRIQTIAAAKLAELEVRMRELRKASKALKTLVHHCRHARPGTPCPIIEAFDH